MLAIFRLFSAVSTVLAFSRTPMGRQLIQRAKAFLANPGNREKAAALAGSIRRPRRNQP